MAITIKMSKTKTIGLIMAAVGGFTTVLSVAGGFIRSITGVCSFVSPNPCNTGYTPLLGIEATIAAGAVVAVGLGMMFAGKERRAK